MDPAMQTRPADLIPVAVLAGLGALGYLLWWARGAVSRYIKAKLQPGAVATALVWVNDTVATLVAEAQQTAVRALKEAAADGSITPQEYRTALAQVRDAVVARAKDLCLGGLTGGVIGLTEHQAGLLLESKVEAAVLASKAGVPSPLASSPQVSTSPGRSPQDAAL